MDRRRFEIATVAAARAMRNRYCTVAHSKFLRDACDDEPTMIAMTGDPDSTALDATDHAITPAAPRRPRPRPRSTVPATGHARLVCNHARDLEKRTSPKKRYNSRARHSRSTTSPGTRLRYVADPRWPPDRARAFGRSSISSDDDMSPFVQHADVLAGTKDVQLTDV